MHARAFQPRLDHDLVAAFDTPTANRVSRHLKARIVHLGTPLVQIIDRGTYAIECLGGRGAAFQFVLHVLQSLQDVNWGIAFSSCKVVANHVLNSAVPSPKTASPTCAT